VPGHSTQGMNVHSGLDDVASNVCQAPPPVRLACRTALTGVADLEAHSRHESYRTAVVRVLLGVALQLAATAAAAVAAATIAAAAFATAAVTATAAVAAAAIAAAAVAAVTAASVTANTTLHVGRHHQSTAASFPTSSFPIPTASETSAASVLRIVRLHSLIAITPIAPINPITTITTCTARTGGVGVVQQVFPAP